MSKEELYEFLHAQENITEVIGYIKEKVGEDMALNEAARTLGDEAGYWKRHYTLMCVRNLVSALKKLERKLK